MEQAKKDEMTKFLEKHQKTSEVQEYLDRAEKEASLPGYARTLISLIDTKIKLHQMKDAGEITKEDFEHRIEVAATLGALASVAFGLKPGKIKKDLNYLEENVTKLSGDLAKEFPDAEEELAREAKLDIRSNEDRP